MPRRCVGAVMEERDLASPGPASQPDGVIRGGVSEGSLGGHLLGEEVGIVDQHIDVARQFEHRRVVLAPALGTRSHLRRAVVGDVGNGGVAVADPVPDRPPALVGDVAGRDQNRPTRRRRR